MIKQYYSLFVCSKCSFNKEVYTLGITKMSNWRCEVCLEEQDYKVSQPFLIRVTLMLPERTEDNEQQV